MHTHANCMHAHIHTHMRAHTCKLHACSHTHTHACTHMQIACMLTYTHTCVHIHANCTHAHIHTCMNFCTNTHKHTHMHNYCILTCYLTFTYTHSLSKIQECQRAYNEGTESDTDENSPRVVGHNIYILAHKLAEHNRGLKHALNLERTNRQGAVSHYAERTAQIEVSTCYVNFRIYYIMLAQW